MSFLMFFDDEVVAAPAGASPATTNLIARYRGSDDSYLTLDSGKITQFLDGSSENNDTDVQATESKRPVTEMFDSKQYISLDGGDEIVLPSALHDTANAACTIVIVARRDSESGNTEAIISGSNGTVDKWYVNFSNTDKQVSFKNFNSGGSPVHATNIDTTKFNIIRCEYDGAGGQSISINGGTAITNNDGQNVSDITSIKIGRSGTSGEHLTGDIAEVLIYDAVQSSGDKSTTDVYLADEYEVYHPNATWIDTTYPDSGFDAVRNALVHLIGANKVYAFANDSTNNPIAYLNAVEDKDDTDSTGDVEAGQFVQLKDLGGNGNHTQNQTSVSDRPLWKTGNLINGKGYIEFDSHYFDHNANLHAVPQADYTVLTIIRKTGNDAHNRHILGMGKNNKHNRARLSYQNVADTFGFRSNSSNSNLVTDTGTLTNWHILEGSREGSTATAVYNKDTAVTNSQAGDFNTITTARYGASSTTTPGGKLQADVALKMIVKGVYSRAKLNTFKDALATIYGLSL